MRGDCLSINCRIIDTISMCVLWQLRLMSLAIENPFKIGLWTVYPKSHLLADDENQTKCDIAPNLMSLLGYLVCHHGRVISRDELVTEVWQGAIVSDESVSRSIAHLRKLLGDSAKSPRYIKAISKQSYQFFWSRKNRHSADNPNSPSPAKSTSNRWYTFKTNQSRMLKECSRPEYANFSFTADGKKLFASQLEFTKSGAGLIETDVASTVVAVNATQRIPWSACRPIL